LEKGVAFGILSLLTFHLTKDEMGYVGLFVFTCALMQTFIGLGTDNYARLCVVKKPSKIKEILTSIWFILACSSIFFFLLMVLNEKIGVYEFLPTSHYYFLFLYSFTSTIISLFLCISQGQKKVLRYFSIVILKITLDLLILLFYLCFLSINFETRLFSLVVTNVIVCTVSSIYLWRGYYSGFQFKKELRETSSFIGKALPNTILVASILVVDKIIIGNKSTSLLGELTFLTGVASPIVYFGEALNKATLPYSFEYLKNSQYISYEKMNIKNIILFILIAVLYLFLINILSPFIFNENYLHVINYLPVFLCIPLLKLFYYSFARIFTYHEVLQKLLYVNLPIGVIYIYLLQINSKLSLFTVIKYILLYQFTLSIIVFFYSSQYFKSNLFKLGIYKAVLNELLNTFIKTTRIFTR
jgi:O-antigen/teichoic acid export membrane protein